MEVKPFGILDLDGVMANFADAACMAHGHPDYVVTHWDFFKDWGITGKEFWRVIHELGDKFYGEMVQPYPWCWDVLELVKEHTRDFVIMSSPSPHPVGYAGKRLWVDKYLPGGKDIKLIVGSEKHLLARPDRVLIDDCDKNIDSFFADGGMTVTFPQPWNKANLAVGYGGNRLTFLANCLRQCSSVV